MLKITKLRKVYDADTVALKHLDLQVKKGEIFILLGANGAGKTTTINLVLGFTEPTSGKIEINGIDARKFPLKAKEFVAYVPENVFLYGNFNSYQNLQFFSKIAGKADMDKADYDKVLTRVGLKPDQIVRPVKSYSKGMRQRLGIAIALIKDAKLILLDEPTSGLDPRGGADFVQLILELKKEGRTILMTTHDIFRAKKLADKIGIMAAGEMKLTVPRSRISRMDLEKTYIKYVQ